MEVLSRSADEFGNDETLEAMWAMRAFEHAEIYFNIICSVDPKILRVTPIDEIIYTLFREEFPNLNVTRINEDDLKSAEEKVKWRSFCERFKSIAEDYSFGTLLRAGRNKKLQQGKFYTGDAYSIPCYRAGP